MSLESRAAHLKHDYPKAKVYKTKIQNHFKSEGIRFKQVRILHKMRDRDAEMAVKYLNTKSSIQSALNDKRRIVWTDACLFEKATL